MIDKRYLNWKSKIGYGAGDVAGNVVYAFLSTFMMFYLTDTVGMNMGIVGILMAEDADLLKVRWGFPSLDGWRK